MRIKSDVDSVITFQERGMWYPSAENYLEWPNSVALEPIDEMVRSSAAIQSVVVQP